MRKIIAEILIKANKGKFVKSYGAEITDYKPDEDVSLFGSSEVIVLREKREKFVNLQTKNNGGSLHRVCKDSLQKELNQLVTSRVAKAKVKKLIVQNTLKYHWTTTYKKASDGSLENRDEVIKDNKKFLMRLSHSRGKKINCVGVPEVQPRRFKDYGEKVLHMHLAVSEKINMRDFWSAWNSRRCLKCEFYKNKKNDFRCGTCEYFRGVVYVKNPGADIFKIGNYFAKYFSKGFDDKDLNQRGFGQHRYLRSGDLKMPTKRELSLTGNQEKILKNWSDFDMQINKKVSYYHVKTAVLNGILKGDLK